MRPIFRSISLASVVIGIQMKMDVLSPDPMYSTRKHIVGRVENTGIAQAVNASTFNVQPWLAFQARGYKFALAWQHLRLIAPRLLAPICLSSPSSNRGLTVLS